MSEGAKLAVYVGSFNVKLVFQTGHVIELTPLEIEDLIESLTTALKLILVPKDPRVH